MIARYMAAVTNPYWKDAGHPKLVHIPEALTHDDEDVRWWALGYHLHARGKAENYGIDLYCEQWEDGEVVGIVYCREVA